MFSNKMDEDGFIFRNKVKLVAKGYCKKEMIIFYETFTPVSRLEAVRTFLAYAAHKNFMVHQMDVKSSFFMSYWKKYR